MTWVTHRPQVRDLEMGFRWGQPAGHLSPPGPRGWSDLSVDSFIFLKVDGPNDNLLSTHIWMSLRQKKKERETKTRRFVCSETAIRQSCSCAHHIFLFRTCSYYFLFILALSILLKEFQVARPDPRPLGPLFGCACADKTNRCRTAERGWILWPGSFSRPRKGQKKASTSVQGLLVLTQWRSMRKTSLRLE